MQKKGIPNYKIAIQQFLTMKHILKNTVFRLNENRKERGEQKKKEKRERQKKIAV